MRRIAFLAAVLAAALATASAAGAVADSVRLPERKREAINPFARKQCNIFYYHYSIKGLHVAGGFSLNLPLRSFTDPQPAAEESRERPEEFAMELLPDLSIGYQKQGEAFFLKLDKSYRRPKFQLYFKLWI